MRFVIKAQELETLEKKGKCNSFHIYRAVQCEKMGIKSPWHRAGHRSPNY